jgi:amidohydrolase family protein
MSAALVQRLLGEFDPTLCSQIFRTFVKNGTWWVPTLVTERADAYAEVSLADPRSRFVLPSRWANWVATAERVRNRPADVRLSLYRKLREIVGLAYRAGVRMMVGTDAGAPFVFKGSGVHEEMVEFAEAGLSPAEVLKAATIDAAEFLGRTADFGSIERGKFADLVILNADPLADIRNTRQIDAVLLGGRYLDRSTLNGMLDGVVKAVKENTN